jgi:2'-5' RNA ligase
MILNQAKRGLFFIAILPPPAASSQISGFKKNISSQHGSKASLNSPPHITLHMPFDWSLKKEDVLLKKLNAFSKSISPCTIKLNNFSCFEPRVIYVDVCKNEFLEEIQKKLFAFCKRQLNLFNARYKELPFHPHITIAFRDLKKISFYKVWDEYKTKTFSTTFNVERITLLKHNGKSWEIFSHFDLQA